MRKSVLFSAIAAVVFAGYFAWTCSNGSRALAQQPVGPSAQNPGPIALVDVNYIFKRHQRLKAQLKDLGAEAEQVQKGFEAQLQQIQAEQQRLNKDLKPGSFDYTQLEERIVGQKSIIQGQIALKRKEFVTKEAHLYYNAYLEITRDVATYCQQRGIVLVLNFNGDPIHDESAEDIARGISNKVVYFYKPLDITPYIVPPYERPIVADNQPYTPNAFTPH